MRPKAVKPKPGQESVWDYPRPPKLEPVKKTIEVYFNGERIAQTTSAFRVLETSHPPTYYIPPGDIEMKFLQSSERTTYCEWKGMGSYYDVVVGDKRAQDAAWYYRDPRGKFSPIKEYVAFYAHMMDRCLVNGEVAEPQPGNFYGGWVTKDIVGPFKGVEGSFGW
jgi:uncharacterized protein (DUF427 family)